MSEMTENPEILEVATPELAQSEYQRIRQELNQTIGKLVERHGEMGVEKWNDAMIETVKWFYENRNLSKSDLGKYVAYHALMASTLPEYVDKIDLDSEFTIEKVANHFLSQKLNLPENIDAN
jgi:hypothetical protein